MLDTRINVGLNGPFTAGTPRKLTVTGTITTYFEPPETTTQQQVVPTGATGVLLNVTGVAAHRCRLDRGCDPATQQVVPQHQTSTWFPAKSSRTQSLLLFQQQAPTPAKSTSCTAPTSSGTVNIVIDIVGYTTNTGLIDLANRVEQLENSGIAGPTGPQGEPGAAGVDAESPARVIWVA